MVDFLLHTGIHLLPEAWHGSHTGRVHLQHRLQHVLWLQVHGQCAAETKAKVTPGPLKDVGEGQETHNDILIRERQHAHMPTEGSSILSMGLHDTLRQARGATGIKDICQVVWLQFVAALLNLVLIGMSLTKSQELVKGNARLVLRIALHLGVKDDQLLHMRLYLHHTHSRVVLVLFAHKDDADVGIGNHVSNLWFTACGIEGDGHRTNAIGSVVHHHALRFVLRKDGNLFLHIYTEVQQSIRHQAHLP